MISDFDLLLSNEYYISKLDAIDLIEKLERNNLIVHSDAEDEYIADWQKCAIIGEEQYDPYQFVEELRGGKFDITDIKIQTIVNWYLNESNTDMRGSLKEFGSLTERKIRLARGKFVTDDTERFYVYERNEYLGRMAIRSRYDFRKDVCNYEYEYFVKCGDCYPYESIFLARISVDLRLINHCALIGYELGKSIIAYFYDDVEINGWPEIW